MTDQSLNQERMAALVGRSLSEAEAKNFDLHLKIAVIKVSDLICDDVAKIATIPEDLQLVIARFYEAAQKEQGREAGVESKKVEDFSIFYREGYDPYEDAIKICRTTLAKYSKCTAEIIHGRTIYECDGV